MSATLHELAGRDRNPVVGQRAGARQGRDLHRQQAVGRSVVRIAEPEVRYAKHIAGVFVGGDRRARSGRRVVHRRDVDGQGLRRRIEINPAIAGAAVVLHLERELSVVIAVGIRGRREHQLAGRDVGDADELAGRDRNPVVGQRAGARQGRDLHRQQAVGRSVVRIAEPEVRYAKHVAGVFVGGDRRVGTGRRVVHRRDIDGQGLRRRIEIDPAIAGAAVVLHLERELSIVIAVGIRGRREHQLAGRDVGDAHELAGRDRNPVVGQRAGARQGRDLHRQQAVGRSVVRIAEPEVRYAKHIAGVFVGGDRRARSGRRVVHRRDVDGHGLRRRIEINPAIAGAAVVLHLERELSVVVAVGIRGRREHQLAGRDVGDADELAGRDRNPVVGQRAGARQGRDLHRQQAVGRSVVRIAEPEVGYAKHIAGVFVGGDRRARSGRRVVHRRDIDGQGLRRRIEINPAIAGAAVVLHLERELTRSHCRWHSRPA